MNAVIMIKLLMLVFQMKAVESQNDYNNKEPPSDHVHGAIKVMVIPAVSLALFAFVRVTLHLLKRKRNKATKHCVDTENGKQNKGNNVLETSRQGPSCTMVRTNCIEKLLGHVFCCYGRFIARHPVWFLIIPVIIAGVLGSGLARLKSNKDVEYLFTPENGQAKEERQIVQNIFHVNDSGQFQVNRLTTLGFYARLIVTCADGGSILRENVVEDIISLDESITNMTVLDDLNAIKYGNVCGKWKDDCLDLNVILSLINRNATNIANLTLGYPEHEMQISGLPLVPPIPVPEFPLQKNTTLFLGHHLGGVMTNDKNKILSASAIQMFYYLDSQQPNTAKQWVDTFHAKIPKLSFLNINVTYFTSQTLETELDKATTDIVPLFSITFTIMITLSIFACMMLDWVLTKPWLGFLGVISAGLAIVSSFGLMLYIGVKFISIVGTTPFLILAIGVDDMFVMLAAWRQTHPRLSVEDRMGQTYREAAVSITITTITDVLAFGIGAITCYPSVKIFCLYTGVAILFDFFYQITFFGACMVLTGKREQQNRHAIMFTKVLPKTKSDHKSAAYKACCAGGYYSSVSEDEPNQSPSDDEIENKHAVMKFFKKTYGPFLMKLPVKIIVLLVFIVYLAVAIWGCTQLEEGLQLRNLAPDDSYATDYYDLQEKYFTSFGPPVAVVFREQLDYSNDTILTKISRLLNDLQDTGYFYGQDYKISWLHSYQQYLNDHDIFVDKNNFTQVLVDKFLNEPAFDSFKVDLKFDESNESIVYSRITIQSKNMHNTTREKNMMVTARNVACTSVFNITVFHPSFIFCDQYITILDNTLQNMGFATACILFVSLLLIPNPVVSVWVLLSIVSICTGVIGFMTLWDVSLDSVAMINIIMCIGFCVDFSAHIAYAFAVADDDEPHARACTALGSLGLPIVQGAFSTVAGVVALAASTVYIFRSFFKIMFLVIMLGALHGIVLLPVIMSLICHTGSTKAKDSNESLAGIISKDFINNSAYEDEDSAVRNKISRR